MNWKNFERGTVCVIRLFNGKPEAIRISQDALVFDWVGCFSIL